MRDTDKRVIKKCTLVRFSCASALSPSLHHCISKRLGEKSHTHTHTHTHTNTHTHTPTNTHTHTAPTATPPHPHLNTHTSTHTPTHTHTHTHTHPHLPPPPNLPSLAINFGASCQAPEAAPSEQHKNGQQSRVCV